ncbi:hypothetical protein SAMN02745172_02482 [Pseudoxanthobacter soli DSM 19599]|uniref:GcrA cell cycle regulator n=1 Tax=Pseudoxanthobacter soli DSM 19599 TaxID=1123029 RepID=A0A1M7ZLQ8_9HYPH|nr:GcrA family cell cycle regulator [Pseudoxanthobacter soli]SHO65835.1 hypothetical protein SAMN02745172_02482 [Pseudoxanthobacter soli DSM 19599]
MIAAEKAGWADSWAAMTREQRVAAIRALLAEGETRVAIAAKLGAPTTNVVVGLIYRYLGDEKTVARSRREAAPVAEKVAAARAKKGAPPPKPAPRAKPPVERAPIESAPADPVLIVCEGPETAAAAALVTGAPAIAMPVAPATAKPLLDLEADECRYQLAGGLFCAAPVARELESWCACHRAVVYLSPAQRKAAKAAAKAAAAAFFGGARGRVSNTLVSPRQR